MDLAAVNRALKELCKLQSFDYVPPFRGRAVHMLEREKEFDELGIDFDEQLRLKDAEYAKLDRVIQYATSRRCRQLEILDYFGDPSKQQCGTCDNCLASANKTSNVQASGGREAPGKPTRRKVETDREAHASRSPAYPQQVVDAVRIVLSGVARMKGRYGKQMVARMLVGSKSKEAARFSQLSTFGLLGALSESQAVALIDALLAARLLMQVEETPRRPLVRLTPQGQEVMLGSAEPGERLHLDDSLVERLLTIQFPAANGSAPQHKTAAATTQKAADVDPFEAANAELAEPAACDEEPVASPSPTHRPDANHEARPPHYWTWRVLASGFSAEECQQIRGITADELCDHLLQAAKSGQPVEPRWVLNPQQLAALDRFVGKLPADRAASRLGNLPLGVKYRDVELYLLARERK
jgi:ATP-dependent DNA helicase RecQ